jgi:hypothetical protein
MKASSLVFDLDTPATLGTDENVSLADGEIRAKGLSKVEIHNLILDEYQDVTLQEIVDSFLYVASKSQLVVDDEGLQVCLPRGFRV